ncbi:unnamed protein product (macronuclear) [Paramecium tetraurelia]|uniref:Uncharacterized protein n=1 Tax=Paramecium tetraurelia TaxID=5888 RepID=A0D9C6_PARTE|nr:uncharacterized protein GSPATT00014573001 [Paramecium tetraurelia]CAK79643.1 unnamed protein product [Paramecium tetraurelia]|eukprot:XP_001447040.1 hypothetical protein (macronuclear) [Paramecium tetraurelia strain d4-2]
MQSLLCVRVQQRNVWRKANDINNEISIYQCEAVNGIKDLQSHIAEDNSYEKFETCLNKSFAAGKRLKFAKTQCPNSAAQFAIMIFNSAQSQSYISIDFKKMINKLVKFISLQFYNVSVCFEQFLSQFQALYHTYQIFLNLFKKKCEIKTIKY